MNKYIIYIAFIVSLFLSFNVSAQIITTVVGNGTGFSGDGGPAIAAGTGPTAEICFDSIGNYYFAEDFLSPRIRKVNTFGIINTVAGNGIPGFSGDSGLATNAQISGYLNFRVDAVGNLFITDSHYKRIRKVDKVTGIINTICGNGISGMSGDGGLASNATTVPYDLCIDKEGNIFIADSTKIRKIDKTTGVISSIANITGPSGMCIDSHGKILIGSALRIMKVDTATGHIDTIAGTGTWAYNGDGIPSTNANFKSWGIATDNKNNIFISDYSNNRIRMIDSLGIIHTIAGNGIAGFSGDSSLATDAEIYDPEGVAIDACGNIYIADEANARIRKVTFDTTCNLSSVQVKNTVPKGNLSLYPNPAYSTITIQASEKIGNIAITNIMGQCVLNKEYKEEDKVEVDISNLQAGVYFVRVNERWERFVKE